MTVDLQKVHLIVCGGRPKTGVRIQHEVDVFTQLDLKFDHIASVTTGVAVGVDTFARNWAMDRKVPYYDFPADWSQGRGAGMVRNRLMVRETIKRFGVKSVIQLGFVAIPLEQSRGTSQCLEYGAQRGLRTHLYRLDLNEWEF